MRDWRESFPHTIVKLEKHGLATLISGFEYELGFQQLRLDLRWFPVFLKMQNCPRRLQELAEFEYLRAAVGQSDGGDARLEPGQVGLNPGAQFLEVHEELPELSKKAGLYGFVKTKKGLQEVTLNLAQALLLDLLREDRKFSSRQLVDQARLHEVRLPLSSEQWNHTLQDLIEIGIVSFKSEFAANGVDC